MSTESLELKTIDSMPGSINELISTNKRLKRPPSLSESFAWTRENIERTYNTSLLTTAERQAQSEQTEQTEQTEQSNDVDQRQVEIKYIIQHATSSPSCWRRSEQYIVAIFIKLLFHITLISIFENVFFFMYVSTLENSGIEKTVNTFINNAVNECTNLTQVQIQIVDDFIEPFINATQIITAGNQEMISRSLYNQKIMNKAWYYVGALSGLFIFTTLYIHIRTIEIKWKVVLFENIVMVLLLAFYELMFFETIIYPYMPLSASEIGRNAVETLQSLCGILE